MKSQANHYIIPAFINKGKCLYLALESLFIKQHGGSVPFTVGTEIPRRNTQVENVMKSIWAQQMQKSDS